MKFLILAMLLAITSCSTEEEITYIAPIRVCSAVVSAPDSQVTDSVSDSREILMADESSIQSQQKIAALKKYLGDVQAELKTLPEVQKFQCRIAAEPIPDKYVMTEKEKVSFRQAGFDPDAIAKGANELMATEREKRKRWKELKQTEEELKFLLEIAENPTR